MTESSLRSIDYAIRGYPEQVSVMRADGMRVYVRDNRLIAEGKFDVAAQLASSAHAYAQGMRGYVAPSADRMHALRDLFEVCQRWKIKVYVLITAIHDVARPALRTQFDLDHVQTEIVRFLRQEQSKFAFSLFDASNPAAFGADPALFYDVTHMQPENMRRAIDRLLSAESRALQ